MALLRYTAKDKTGKTISGVSDAIDQRALIDHLRKESLVILSIEEEKEKKKSSFSFKFESKVKLGELVLFSRQLATLVDSGIPLVLILVRRLSPPSGRVTLIVRCELPLKAQDWYCRKEPGP